MDVSLPLIAHIRNTDIQITGSKSETNRLLVLQALYPEISILNSSNCDDSYVLRRALASTDVSIDIHHAGTAMRFLTAYFAIQKGRKIILTGSERMKERPIKILVDALTALGANIQYQEQTGYPPLVIEGTTLDASTISLDASVSSQYVSALLLIASSLPEGLIIQLKGEITSTPYIQMTYNLLRDLGIAGSFDQNQIMIKPCKTVFPKKVTIESDWSSASYFYSVLALSPPGTVLTLGSFKKQSYQGDAILSNLYSYLGVQTSYKNDKIILKKHQKSITKFPEELNLSNAPDIAQTLVVSCFALGVPCYLTGLHTLKIKETDRLLALKTEIEKLGGKVKITPSSLQLTKFQEITPNITIKTYNDHRMAMAFAPLALRSDITISDADVVSKSYPEFWTDFKKIGFKVNPII